MDIEPISGTTFRFDMPQFVYMPITPHAGSDVLGNLLDIKLPYTDVRVKLEIPDSGVKIYKDNLTSLRDTPKDISLYGGISMGTFLALVAGYVGYYQIYPYYDRDKGQSNVAQQRTTHLSQA